MEIIRLMEVGKPKVVVLENVSALRSHDGGNTFKTICEEIEQQGYSIDHKILKCSDYGLPQMRKRLFIVCVRNDIENDIDIFDLKEYEKDMTMKEYLGKNFEKKHAYTIRCGGAHTSIDKKQNWDGYMVDGEVYRLTISDAKKLQGFDDNFYLSEEKKYKRHTWRYLGNTIPTKFTEMIGYKVKAVLNCGKNMFWTPKSSLRDVKIHLKLQLPIVKSTIKMHDFNALSLFSGCGGDTLGMNNSYINVKWYSELSKKFRASHDMNFKDCECLGGDITEISDETFESLNGKCDVVFGGFPCQSFSQAGKKCATDPRGQLYLHFVRAVKCVQPKFFIGENVKGLLTRVTSDGRKFIDVIAEAFKEIGYTCEYKLFKCNEYGTPQKRERVILIGWKNGEKYNHKWVRPDKKEATLENVVKFDMEGAVEVPKAVFDQIGVPETSILTGEGTPTGTPHAYVKRAVERELLTFSKRSARDAVEVVDTFEGTEGM